MDKLLRIFTTMDWLVGGLSIVIGLYLQNWWVVAGGFVGLAAAYFKPALIIKAKLEKKFLRKKAKTDDSAVSQAEDVFYAQMLGQQLPDEVVKQETVSLPPRTYRDSLPPYAGIYLSGSRHNQVSVRHLKLVSDDTESIAQAKVPPQYH